MHTEGDQSSLFHYKEEATYSYTLMSMALRRMANLITSLFVAICISGSLLVGAKWVFYVDLTDLSLFLWLCTVDRGIWSFLRAPSHWGGNFYCTTSNPDVAPRPFEVFVSY